METMLRSWEMKEGVERVKKALESKYTIKMVARIRAGTEAEVLNCIERCVPTSGMRPMRMESEADQRRVEVLVSDLGLKATGADMLRVRRSEKQVFAGRESPALDRAGTTLYRSGTMRLSYLGLNRPHVQETAKFLARNMKAPTEHDLQELERVARYLIGRPRAGLVFEEQEVPRELDAWEDSDYAGDAVTRRSTAGLVLMSGGHGLKTSSTLPGPIGLSSGESEFYPCVKGGAKLLGMVSLTQDRGISARLALVLRTDGGAAKGLVSRGGLGEWRPRLAAVLVAPRSRGTERPVYSEGGHRGPT